MTDFTSGFWPWFIGIATLLSVLACYALLRWMARGKPPTEIKTLGHVWDGDLAELNNPMPGWWMKLFYLTIVFSLVYLVLYPGLGALKGAFGWTQLDQYQREMTRANALYGPIYEKFGHEELRALAADPEARAIGHRLFMTYCTNCHGADAGGGPGFPSLRDYDWLYGGAPENIEASIANGRNGAMPPWGAMLGEEGVFNVAEYVRSLSGRDVNINAAALGKEKFMQLCVACHGADARGNAAMGAPNLTDPVWLYGGSQRAIMDSIRSGRNGRMPAWQEFLGPAKVHLLAAYVYGLSEVQDHDGARP